jgi:hypothetical protein
MWVRFLDSFDFRPPEKRNVLIHYRPGYCGSVRRVCGEQAIAHGAAVEIPDWRNLHHRAHEEARDGRRRS